MIPHKHLERFIQYCGNGNNQAPMPDVFLSLDRTMGIMKVFKEELVVFEASMKFKFRPNKKWLKFGADYVTTKRILDAMKILHRRRYLTIGLIKLNDNTTSHVFFLREGKRNVLVAPVMPDPELYDEDTIDILDCIEPCSGVIMDWITYSRLFDTRRIVKK